jgi:hypothetical protein
VTGGPIEAYVAELERELRRRRTPRRRLLAEAEDHLRSAADDLERRLAHRERAEREATRRFGAPAVVAAAMACAAAARSTRLALAWAAAAATAYALAGAAVALHGPRWLGDFPHGAPSAVAVQLAAVALVLSVVRLAAGRRAHADDVERLRLAANGLVVASGALAAAAAAELLLAATRPAPAPWSEATAVLVVLALAAALALPAAAAAGATAVRTGALDRAGAPPSLAADIAALAPRLAPAAHAALARPGRLCAGVAAAAALAVGTREVAGTDYPHHASLVLGAAATAAVEAVAVVACYAAFGRALGLRPARYRRPITRQPS